jgi:dipeptidyl aminopeptidase/acylaminoacyl peptidase
MFVVACGRAHDTAPATTGSNAVSYLARAEPQRVTFASGSLELGGYLFVPPGPGPFPAIVWNHGSEEHPKRGDYQAQFYVAHGFALFAPHRRGQGLSASAGRYIGSLPDEDMAAELATQTDDVMAAVAYLASRPEIDSKRIAVIGCSFGGIEALLAAARGTGIVAAVDFAGGAMTWARVPSIRDLLTTAARTAKVPVFFIQAENDYDTSPSRVLSEEMKAAGGSARVHIFPANGTSAAQGHAFCNAGEHPAWGDEVMAFLAETMGR